MVVGKKFYQVCNKVVSRQLLMFGDVTVGTVHSKVLSDAFRILMIPRVEIAFYEIYSDHSNLPFLREFQGVYIAYSQMSLWNYLVPVRI